MLAIALVSLAVPVVAGASGGGSAGDQQYTDPFATPKPQSGGTKTATLTQTYTSPTPAAAPTPPTSAPTPSAATAPATTPAPSPTATAAAPVHQLPFTGYDGWLAGVTGVGLLAAGAGLRLRLRRSSPPR